MDKLFQPLRNWFDQSKLGCWLKQPGGSRSAVWFLLFCLMGLLLLFILVLPLYVVKLVLLLS